MYMTHWNIVHGTVYAAGPAVTYSGKAAVVLRAAAKLYKNLWNAVASMSLSALPRPVLKLFTLEQSGETSAKVLSTKLLFYWAILWRKDKLRKKFKSQSAEPTPS